jgi:penicillin-binding protein 1A
MPRSSPGTKARTSSARSAARGRPPSVRRLLRWALLLALVLSAAGALLAVGLVLYYTADPALPTIDKAGDYRPKVMTRVLSRDGQLIGEIFEERRTVVPRSRIPQVVINAFVDAEDAQFFEHKGLDYWGMLRAMLHNLRPGAHLHGASTITQQLVRTYLLKTDARTLKRKVQEMYLSLRLERVLAKEDILWIYLSQIYFGHGRYGIEEAARFYFGKSVSEVSIGQAALLASLPKAPEEISPRKNPERAKERQRYVLSQMVRYGHISKDEGERAAAEPIRLVKDGELVTSAPEFVDEVERFLEKKFGEKEIPYLGLNVRTTCDVEVQKVAREALERNLQRLDERQGYRGRLRRLSAKDREAHLKALAREYPSGPPQSKIIEGVVLKVEDGDGLSGAGAQVAIGPEDKDRGRGWLPLPARPDRYNPQKLMPSKRFAPGDVVRVRVDHVGRDGPVLALENGPQGALVVIEPSTRHVLAMVGGYGFGRGGFNRALRAKRQPGSAFKPFLFAAAFASKRFTPASILNDSPQIYGMKGMEPWKPKNAETHGFLGPVRLRVALARSLNSVASQLIADLQPGPVIEMAQAAGIRSTLEPNPSLALGTSVVTPLELTSAYATFAAAGRRGEPQMLLQVGEEKLPAPELVQGMSAEVAFLTSAVLRSVIEEGTGVSARDRFKVPVAGKTGTTNDQKDAWFVGYTPEVAAGVWVGFDDMHVLGEREQGARAALPVWIEVMGAALKTRRAAPFVQPAGVVVARIDPATGKLAAPGTEALDEYFLEGTQPTEQALAPGESDPNTFNQVP